MGEHLLVCCWAKNSDAASVCGGTYCCSWMKAPFFDPGYLKVLFPEVSETKFEVSPLYKLGGKVVLGEVS